MRLFGNLVPLFLLAILFSCADDKPQYYPCECDDSNVQIGDTRIVDDGGEFGYRVGEYSSLKFDVNNIPYVSYYDSSNGNLKHATMDLNQGGRPWILEVVDSGITDDTDADVGMHTSMELDVFTQPHICYEDRTNSRLKYATRSFDGWHTFIIAEDIDAEKGAWCSLAIKPDPEDAGKATVLISYVDGNTDSLMFATIEAYDESATPTNWLVDSGNIGSNNAIGLIDGQPVIAYYDDYQGYPKIARLASEPAGWQIEPLKKRIENELITIDKRTPHSGLTRFDLIHDPDLVDLFFNETKLTDDQFAFEDTRKIVISDEAYSALMVADATEETWSLSYDRADMTGDIPDEDFTGRWISMKIDLLGNIHLAYQDETNQDLFYAVYDGETWDFKRIVSNGSVGFYTSIGVLVSFDDPGRHQPVIAYYNVSSNDLMLALRRETGVWENYTVSTWGQGGIWPSLDTIYSRDGWESSAMGLSFYMPGKSWLMFSFLYYY